MSNLLNHINFLSQNTICFTKSKILYATATRLRKAWATKKTSYWWRWRKQPTKPREFVWIVRIRFREWLTSSDQPILRTIISSENTFTRVISFITVSDTAMKKLIVGLYYLNIGQATTIKSRDYINELVGRSGVDARTNPDKYHSFDAGHVLMSLMGKCWIETTWMNGLARVILKRRRNEIFSRSIRSNKKSRYEWIWKIYQ